MSTSWGSFGALRDESSSRGGTGRDEKKDKLRATAGGPDAAESAMRDKDLKMPVPVQDRPNPFKTPPPSLELVIVDSMSKVKNACRELAKCSVLAVDCEGVALSRQGRLCLVQVASKKKAFIFDVVLVGPKLFSEGGLGAILESKSSKFSEYLILISLSMLFGIRLQKVFDTQVAYAAIREEKGKNKPIPVALKTLLRYYSAPTIEEENLKNLVKYQFSQDNDYWARRPLSEQALTYSKFDVEHLIPVWKKMQKVFAGPETEKKIMESSAEYVAAFRDHDDGPQKAQKEFLELIEKANAEKEAREAKRSKESGKSTTSQVKSSLAAREGDGNCSSGGQSKEPILESFRFYSPDILRKFET